MRAHPKADREGQRIQRQPRTEEKYEPPHNVVFTNIVMSLAMKIRDRAKAIRSLQQEDLKNKQELKKYESKQFEAGDLMRKDDEFE